MQKEAIGDLLDSSFQDEDDDLPIMALGRSAVRKKSTNMRWQVDSSC